MHSASHPYYANLGRYLQPEPLSLKYPKMAASPAYSYARSNPMRYVDPDGKFVRSTNATCNNWSASIALARKWAGCGDKGSDKSCKCQQARKNKACDPCEALEEGKGPYLYFKMFGNNPHKEFGETFKPGIAVNPKTAKGNAVRVEHWQCDGPENVTELADTLLHEAFHYCAEDEDPGDPGADNLTKKCRGLP